MIGNITRKEIRNKLLKINRIIGYTNYMVSIGNGIVDITYYIKGFRINITLQPIEFAVFSDDELSCKICEKICNAIDRYIKECERCKHETI